MTSKRKRNALSAVFIQSVQDQEIYSDGNLFRRRRSRSSGGRSGTKHWFQQVTIDGKRRSLGLGAYPTVTLAEARNAAVVNARTIREGRDPLAEKRETIAARQKSPGMARAQPQQLGGLGHRVPSSWSRPTSVNRDTLPVDGPPALLTPRWNGTAAGNSSSAPFPAAFR